MATGKIKKDMLDYVRADLTLSGVNLTANKSDANSVDFSSLVDSNTPAGYEFDHLEFVGVWPQGSWTNAIVTRCMATNSFTQKNLSLATTTTQNYIVKAIAWYKRVI